MAYNNGIMTAPISIQEVRSMLGESTTTIAPANNVDVDATVKDLCGSSNINIWSAIKPCRYDSLSKMRPATINGVPDDTDPNKKNIILANQTLVKYSDTVGTIGILFPNMMKITEAGYYRAGNGTAQQTKSVSFRLDVPTGYDGTHYYVSRLADFDGYNHLATAPFKMSVANISVNSSSFRVTFALNRRDENSVIVTTFDYGIYKNVIWRLGVVVGPVGGSLSEYKLHVAKDSTVANQESLLKTNGFIQKIDTDTFKIEGSIPTNGGTYNFIGVLVAYKVTQSTSDSSNVPIVTTISHIVPSSTDTSYCGIPMPCDVETVDFEYVKKIPTVVITASTTTITLADTTLVDSSDILNNTGDLMLQLDVDFTGGDDLTIVNGSNLKFELKIDGKSYFYRWLDSMVLNSSVKRKKTFYIFFDVKYDDSVGSPTTTTHGISAIVSLNTSVSTLGMTLTYNHSALTLKVTNKILT